MTDIDEALTSQGRKEVEKRFAQTQASATFEILMKLRKAGLLNSIDGESFCELLVAAQHGGKGLVKVREFIARHTGRGAGG